jgi:hypothetical protein
MTAALTPRAVLDAVAETVANERKAQAKINDEQRAEIAALRQRIDVLERGEATPRVKVVA